MSHSTGIWCLEEPVLEGPSELRFFESQAEAVVASGLSYLEFEPQGSQLVAFNTCRCGHYPRFYIWEVMLERVEAEMVER